MGWTLWQVEQRRLKQFCPEKRSAKHIKPQWPTLIFHTLYRKHEKQTNWGWTLPLGDLPQNAKPQTQFVFNLWERPMLRPERSKILLGVHKCLGSRRPMFCPERNKILLGVHKCLGSRRPMRCPERNKIRLGVHKCLGSKRPMLCREQTVVLHALSVWPR